MLEVGKHIDQIWNMGVNDSTFSILPNPRWYEGSTEPKYYTGDKSITYHESDPPMFNFFEYNTFLLPTGYNFSVAEITTNGSSSYKLPFKCADIFSVAIKLKVDILSVSSSSIFTLPLAQSDAMGKFDARFNNNNALLLTPSYFLCRITNPSDNTQYFRSFTISGQTITLNTINTTTPEGISGLAKNWTFELMGAFNMILEGTIVDPTILTGICTKNITIGTGEATINFLNRDITGGTNLTLEIVYYALQNSSPQYFNNDSILQHGIYDKAQKIDFPIQQSQLTQLQNNSEKYYQPQRKFTLVTCRPSKLKIDDSIYINVTPYPEGNYKVSSMTERLVHPNGEITGTTFDEVTYEFTNYEFNLDTVILSLKNKDALAKAKVAQITNRTYTITRHTIVTLDRLIVDSTAGGKPPINITKSNITGNSFDASWTVVGTPDSLNLYFTSNYFADSVIIPLANNITTYSFTGLTGGTYSFKLTSVTNGRESTFSDTKDVIITNSNKDFQTNTNTLLYWKGQEGSGTVINDQTSNNKNANIIGATTNIWDTGLISSDSTSIKLNGTDNYIESVNTDNTNFVDFTLRSAFRFNTGDRDSKTYHTLAQKADFTDASDSGNLVFEWVIRASTIELYTVDSSQAPYNPKYLKAYCTYNFAENQNYTIQASFKLNNPLNSNLNLIEFCVNGVKQTTILDTAYISNISSVKQCNKKIKSGELFNNLAKLSFIRPLAVDTEFRNESQALADYNNLLL